MTTRQILARTIKNTAVYYGRELQPEVLSMMCDDLEDLSHDEVIRAYEVYRRNPKNRMFPLPAQIRELITPEQFITPEERAAEAAARICAAVPKYGWCNARAAEEFIGPTGWAVVQRQGGWSYICEHLGVALNPSTFQAQVRKQLESSFKYGTEAVENSIRQAIGKTPGGLVPIGEITARLIEKKKVPNET